MDHQTATKRYSSKLNAPTVAGLTFLAGLLYISLKLTIGGFDVSRFITAGDLFVNASQLDAPVHILPDSAGYDGQFYYRLAIDPFTRQPFDHGVSLDNPPFRMQRIGYPLIIWLLSGRGATIEAIPWLMVLVNLIAVVVIAVLGAKMVAQFQQPPAWGLLLAFYPGLVASLSRNLTECVALAFALAAINSAQSKRHLAAGLLGAFAVLCRETTLLILVGFGVMQLLEIRRWKIAWVWYLLPLIAFLVWQAFLAHWWSQPPHSGGLQDLGTPFAGYLRLLWNCLFQSALFSANPIADWLMRSYTLVAALSAGLTLILIFPRLASAPMALVIPWIAYAGLVICLSNVIWLSPGEFLRAFTETYALSILIAAATASTCVGQWLAIAWAIVMIPTLVVFLR